MSNDVAFPVLRTPDPALALATARQLMRLGRDKHSDVSLYAEVTLLLNTRTRELDEPSDDHTVLLHVRSVLLSDGGQAQEPYAHWLASQVGLAVIGPGQRT